VSWRKPILGLAYVVLLAIVVPILIAAFAFGCFVMAGLLTGMVLARWTPSAWSSGAIKRS
jgi:predicted Na+-dependent transporter